MVHKINIVGWLNIDILFKRIKKINKNENFENFLSEFKKFIKFLYIKIKNDTIIKIKLYILTKRIFKIILNNFKQILNYNLQNVLTAISFIITKQTFNMTMTKILEIFPNINIVNLNDILNLFYRNLSKEKVIFNTIN